MIASQYFSSIFISKFWDLVLQMKLKPERNECSFIALKLVSYIQIVL